MKTVKWLCASVLLLIVMATTSGSAARLQPYDAFYAFGDSLVDNGNDFVLSQLLGFQPAIPPSVSPHASYYQRRFSNGPVAFEYLWQRLSGVVPGSPGSLRPLLDGPISVRDQAIDFAFGGSGTGFFDQTPGGFSVPGLRAQVDLFRLLAWRGAPRAGRALYAIFTGAGDYFRTTPLPPSQSVGNIVAAVRTLYALGARDIIVVNLPDLGSIPMFAGGPLSAELSQLTAAHNALLAAALAQLQTELPEINLVAIDVNAVLQQVPPSIDTITPALDALLPAAPGEPLASRCVFVDPTTCRDAPTFDVDLQFLFWDAEHPTTAVHALLGDYVFGQLAQSAQGRLTNN